MGRSRLQNEQVVVFGNETVATNATSANLVDCLGQRQGTLYVTMDSATATNSSAKWSSMVIQHGTTTDVSNFTAIAGLTGTTEATATTNQFILQTHNDSTNAAVHIFDLDLSVLERYVRVVKQAPASHFTTSDIMRFTRPGETPAVASGRGPASGTITVYQKMSGAAASALA